MLSVICRSHLHKHEKDGSVKSPAGASRPQAPHHCTGRGCATCQKGNWENVGGLTNRGGTYQLFKKTYTVDWENFKKYTIDDTCPLSPASGGFGQENHRTKDNVYIFPDHVSRHGARPPIRKAIMPRSQERDNYRLVYYFQKIYEKFRGWNNTLPLFFLFLTVTFFPDSSSCSLYPLTDTIPVKRRKGISQVLCILFA